MKTQKSLGGETEEVICSQHKLLQTFLRADKQELDCEEG